MPPDLAKVAEEGGEVAGPGEVFTVSRAPSSLEDPAHAAGLLGGGGTAYNPGILGGAGSHRYNSDAGFGATAVADGVGKAIAGQLKYPFDMVGRDQGNVLATSSSAQNVLAMLSSA